MISPVLLKREAKANWKLLLIILAVLTMYCAVIVIMFDPEFGDSIKALSETMPEIFNAFGMGNTGAVTLTGFLSNYLYGFLLVVLPLVFIIILANRLIARYVDSGSMAYLLATPNGRVKIALTQAVFLLLSVIALNLFVTLLLIIFSKAMFPGQLDCPRFIMLNTGLLGLHVFLSGLCFCASCIFNDTKRSNGVGAGLTIAFILIQMLSNVDDKLESLKYATPLTLFNPDNILAGEPGAGISFIILYITGLILFFIGIASFSRRDLHI
ncbi:MAG: ABC transporter permease subunit [Clostridiales bacterium]|jgi:ABC-2 type transport system permease protein|nr:ABC transporter permease subunit [Clostridiales bacterium]